MIKKYINLSILLFLFTFIFLVSKHYFSDKNIILTNKSRSSYSLNPTIDLRNLPLLKNDTDNIVEVQNVTSMYNIENNMPSQSSLRPQISEIVQVPDRSNVVNQINPLQV